MLLVSSVFCVYSIALDRAYECVAGSMLGTHLCSPMPLSLCAASAGLAAMVTCPLAVAARGRMIWWKVKLIMAYLVVSACLVTMSIASFYETISTCRDIYHKDMGSLYSLSEGSSELTAAGLRHTIRQIETATRKIELGRCIYRSRIPGLRRQHDMSWRIPCSLIMSTMVFFLLLGVSRVRSVSR